MTSRLTALSVALLCAASCLAVAAGRAPADSSSRYVYDPPTTPTTSLANVASSTAAGESTAPAASRPIVVASRRASAAEDGAAIGESFLDSGAGVHYSESATAIGDDENTLQNCARSRSYVPGHDVIVHGAEVDGDGTQFFVSGLPTHAQQIADAILGNPDYAGGPINLVTCGGACGPAGELGDILGVDVNAFPGPVDLDPGTGYLREH